MRRKSVFLASFFSLLAVAALAAAPAPKADPSPPQIRALVVFNVPMTNGSTAPARCENIDGKARLTILADGAFLDFGIVAWGPGPSPQPTPVPPTPPPPEPMWGALIIEESSQRTPQLAAILTNQEVRKHFTDGKLAFRVADPDEVDAAGKTPADLAPWIAKAKTAGLPRLFLLGTKGGELYAGPVPATAAALLNLVKSPGKKESKP